MRIGLVAGEASGDQLGAGLIGALKAVSADTRFEGVAGPLMRSQGCESWEDSDALAVMGLIEPLREIPRLLRLRRMLIRRWSESPPDVFVGIDAPDFNLGLERALKARGIRTIQYVSPQVWAWRQGRVRKIARSADLVLCLLPFEQRFYEEHGVAARFVGHPMADRVAANVDTQAARERLGLSRDRVIAVLPGSRASEVTRLGADFAGACRLLQDRDPSLSFVSPMARAGLADLFAGQLEEAGINEAFTLVDGDAADAISAADVVLLASGTATLQTALHQKPMVAAYRFAALTYFIGKHLRVVKVPHFTLPNLLTDEPMVPELVQNGVSPGSLAGAVSALLNDDARRAEIASTFGRLREQLALGADRLAAESVRALATA